MTNYAKLDRLRHKVQAQVNRDRATLCIVALETNGERTLLVRSPSRAFNLTRKNAGAIVLATVEPEEDK